MTSASVGAALRVAVAGNPNVGKTSLFNVLTSSRHRVGNYPGVTVEQRIGALATKFGPGRAIELIDLPGTYSLTAVSDDEAVAFRSLSGADDAPPDVVLLVLNAANLARNLYLALQVLELGKPVVIALNMVDAARDVGLRIEVETLARELGVRVLPTVARTGEGVPALVAALREIEPGVAERRLLPPASADAALASALAHDSAPPDAARARWLLTCEAAGRREVAGASGSEAVWLDAVGRAECLAAARELIALRYRHVDAVLAVIGHQTLLEDAAPEMTRSQRLDRVLTHKLWGLGIFISVMAMVFVSIFSWAEPVMDVIEALIAVLAGAVSSALGPGLLTELLTDGVVAGVGNVLVFVPQIALLFLFIGLLEDSGYLARAAFLLDRLMARLGLHGRAFIPLLSGYACAIPAILSTRTISSWRDRMVTMLMIPFMSCSARLPIYALVIGALFVSQDPWLSPSVDRGLVLLCMYGLSTASALAMGFIYKRTLLRSPTPPLVLELPPYRVPRLRNTALMVWDRTRDFVRNAGTVILAFTIVLWAVLSFPREDTGAGTEGPTAIGESYGGRVARSIEPALEPIGQDWRMGVGIVGSFAAREVLVSTLGLVYGMEADDDNQVQLRQAIRDARDPDTGKRRYSPLSGLALMVFFVYACQCMSTLAVVRRETRSWRWPIFMFASMTGLAYVAALLVFQVGLALGFG